MSNFAAGLVIALMRQEWNSQKKVKEEQEIGAQVEEVIEETDMEMDTSLRNSQDEFVICFHIAIAP